MKRKKVRKRKRRVRKTFADRARDSRRPMLSDRTYR